MDEAVITQIVKRVLAELSLVSPNGKLGLKKKLLILSDNPEGLQAKMNWMRSEYADDYELYGIREAGYTLPNSIEEVGADEVKHHKWDKVFLAFCSVNTLVKIALGLRGGSSAELIGIALSKGTPVEIETPSFGFTPTTHESYKQLLEGYLAQTAGFGVVFRSPAQSISGIAPSVEPIVHEESSPFYGHSSTSTPVLASAQVVTHYEKRLLTEREVNRVPEKTILLVKKGAILTPLAQDALKLRNINVQIAEEG